MNHANRSCNALVLALLLGMQTGCSSIATNPNDPMEGFNRAMFSFNDTVDEAALKPAATAYKAITPSIVQTGVGNFFGNLHDVSTALNNILQARIDDAMSDIGRVLINSTFGLAGLIDVASPIGLPKHSQDFGQTLGRWGVGSGPYVVLPLLGPSTMRDAVAEPVDFETNLWNHTYPVRSRNTGTAIRIVDSRASLLDSTSFIENAALDRYEFVRDAYLQYRQNKIYRPEASEQNSIDKKNDDEDFPVDSTEERK